MRCGLIAIVGPPNAGKSTLLNRLVGEAISIVSPVAQTTRHRILGVLHRPDARIGLLDTPGFHLPRTAMNRIMIEAIDAALEPADAILLLVSASGRRSPPERFARPVADLLDRLRRIDRPVVLGLTKTDLVRRKEALLPLMACAADRHPFREILPCSPLTGDGVEDLVRALVRLLPESQPPWADDDLTDRPMRFLAGERVREALTRLVRQEVPHSVAVVVDRYEDAGRDVRISATIVVDRKAHKAIVVGKGGERIKRVGMEARGGLSEWLGRPVHLSLFVKVEEGWTRDARRVRELTGA